MSLKTIARSCETGVVSENDGPRAVLKMLSCGRLATQFLRMRRRITRDDKGHVAVIFGLTLVPVIGLVGASVDYGRVLQVRTRMQDQIDTSVLAGGRQFQLTGSTSAADQTTRDYFASRFNATNPSVGNPVITSVSVDTSLYKVTGVATAAVPTPFLSAIGTKTVNITVTSATGLSLGGQNTDKNLEVSMVIDTTGSMADTTSSGGTKISDAKLAANDLVDILIPTSYTGTLLSRVAIAPFSNAVNVGSSYFNPVTNQSSGSTCIVERNGANQYTDAPPNAGNGYFNKMTSSCAENSKIVPLTNDKTTLKNTISGLVANGGTAGHLGTAWGWYLLSQNWGSIWPAANRPETNSATVMKVMVLMTDGDYNTSYNGIDSSTQAATLCTNMKNAGIIVYTIGFGTNISAVSLTNLRNCASSPNQFFNAQNGDQLRVTFRSIAFTLTQLRLTQ